MTLSRNDARVPHPVFRWIWLVVSLELLASLWIWPSYWFRLAVLLQFIAFETAAKVFDRDRFLETLSGVVSWTHRFLTRREPAKRPWQGWNALLFTPYCICWAYVAGDTLHTASGDIVLSIAVGTLVGIGLYTHWIGKL